MVLTMTIEFNVAYDYELLVVFCREDLAQNFLRILCIPTEDFIIHFDDSVRSFY